MTFIEIQNEVKRRLARDFSSDIDTYLKTWINNAVRSIMMERRWKVLRAEDTISTVEGTGEYVLPFDFGTLGFFWHRILGYNYKLIKIPECAFVKGAFIGTTEGTPYWYRMFNTKNVLAQPSSPSKLTVVSSSDNDNTSSDIVFIKGIVEGYPDYEQVQLQGTTPVTTSKTFSSVLEIVKAQDTDGRITVTAGDDIIGVLPAGFGSQALRRKWVKFYYIPDTTGETIYVYYYKRFLKMVNDYDVHPLGDDFDEAIIL